MVGSFFGWTIVRKIMSQPSTSWIGGLFHDIGSIQFGNQCLGQFLFNKQFVRNQADPPPR